MDIKNKHIATICDENGNCEFVAKVKVVNDRELNRLQNEANLSKAKREQKDYELKTQVVSSQEKIKKLEERDLLLAKSIYDNFVDRGLIDNDDDFQQAYFDYIFNGKEINFESAPKEYLTILRRIRHESE